ncbi:MAG: adenine phosphoribosyltransferase, partial [Acidimicrobiales bacterium]
MNNHPDVAGVLRDAELLPLVAKALADPFRDAGVTAVLSPEARGPILGALVAVELGAGLVLARKNDQNHPGADTPVESAPTWRGRSETFLGRSFDLGTSDRVLIVDDWITTGNTMR